MRIYLLSILFLMSSATIYSQNIYDGLVGYWPMNCNVQDSSGNNLNGTIIGNPSCTIGRVNESLRFVEGDYVNFPQNRSLEMISENGFTWSVWFKLDSLPQSSAPGLFQTFISFADPGNSSDIYLGIGSLTAPRNELAFIVDGPGGVGSSASNNLADLRWKPLEDWEIGRWYHAAGLRDYENNIVELYFDGIKVDSASYLDAQEPFTEAFPFQFGRFFDGETASNNFTGELDEIRIYERPLSEEEVLILFSARPEQLSTETTDINFQNIKCKADSTILIEILNEGPSEFIISNFELKQGEAFEIVNQVTDRKLLNQEPFSLGIRFDPPEEQTYYDTIFVNNPFGVQPMIIYLEGSKDIQINVPERINFGELVSCESSTFFEAELLIENINIDEGLSFNSVWFSNYSMESSTLSPIPEGELGAYILRFTPNELGVIGDTAYVQFDNCDLSYPIYISANYTFLDKEYPSEINFGNSEVGVENSRIIPYENTGTTTITIVDIEYLNTDPEFSLSTGTFNIGDDLKPSSTMNLEVDFTPNGGASEFEIVVVSDTRCGLARDTIKASGNGVYRATFNMMIKERMVNIGDEIDFELDISNALNLDLAEIDSIGFDLKLNNTVFGNHEFELSEQQDNTEIWESNYRFNITPSAENLDQSFNLGKAKIALGNESIPVFIISNIEVFGGLATIVAQNSTLFINDICEDGEVKRLIFSNDWLELGNVSPNPAWDNITFDFSLIEPGITSIKLYDNFGNLVDVVFEHHFNTGSYEINYSVSKLNSGLYFYVLQTPTQKLTKKFRILK